ncbi:MAG: bifunctional methionine sulfoxide reductase B/A protein [Bacteroidales bacterium]
MKHLLWMLFIFLSCSFQAQDKKTTTMKYNELNDAEKHVILNKGTERPFTGEYTNNKSAGTYVCKQCNAPLYESKDKFDSGCGWPSFDDEIEGAVIRIPDPDGMRTEIICANCGAHLGHVFLNEGFTAKDTRHCVNSISLVFIPNGTPLKPTIKMKQDVSKAYFASGCFWGTEYYFRKLKGVKATAVGFMGGHVDNPSYKDVCTKTTGHVETTEIEYDPKEVSYEDLVKYFFETHDFTQADGQGPDIGPQYLSVIFYSTPEEKAIAEKYIKILEEKGYKVATTLRPASEFWKAEDYHQQYYEHKGSTPYCHSYKKIF